jgi:hypothetical protein
VLVVTETGDIGVVADYAWCTAHVAIEADRHLARSRLWATSMDRATRRRSCRSAYGAFLRRADLKGAGGGSKLSSTRRRRD